MQLDITVTLKKKNARKTLQQAFKKRIAIKIQIAMMVMFVMTKTANAMNLAKLLVAKKIKLVTATAFAMILV